MRAHMDFRRGAFRDGVERIDEKVEDDLFKPDRVRRHLGRVRARLDYYSNARCVGAMQSKINGGRDALAGIDGLALS